jgi:branched-chain amino acid transport system ATP-binding protein
VLELRALGVHYGRIHALRAVSLRVQAGEIVAVLGSNGAGKSTTLRAISGLLRPSGGQILLDGHPVGGLAAHRVVAQGVIHCPEGRQVFPRMSVRENLLLGAHRCHDRAEVAARVERAHALFPILHERAGQTAGTLSGGEQQMLAIGRALMSRPKVVLLDEPSLGLAPMLVEEIFGIVGSLVKQEKLAVLLVEQNATMALAVAHHGYVMENGRIVLEGPADKLRDNSDIKEFYLGLNEGGARKSYRDTKHYKRRKRWLS